MTYLDQLFLPIYYWVAQKATSLESERRLFSRAGLQFGGLTLRVHGPPSYCQEPLVAL